MSFTTQASQYSKNVWLESSSKGQSEASQYHLYGIFNYEVTPDIACLRDALQQVVNNHYNLRSNFREHAGELLQVIHPSLPVNLDHYAVDDKAASEALVQKIIQTPFNLAEEPLFRFVCIEDKNLQETTFLGIFHHLVIDSIQFEQLMAEIGHAYQHTPDLTQTDEEQITALQSYLAWESELTKKTNVNYWLQRLQNYPLQIDFPFIGSAVDSTEPKTHATFCQLDQALSTRIQQLGKTLSCSVFDVVKTAWALLISIYTDQDKLVISYPFSLRRRAHKTVKGAFAATGLFPFERTGTFRTCIAAQNKFKHSPHSRYINSVSVLSQFADASFSCAVSAAKLRVKGPLLASTPRSQFNIGMGSKTLCLFLDAAGDTIQFEIVAAKNLFNKDTLDQLSCHLCTLLDTIVENPEQDLSTISCLTSQEYEVLVEHWNRTSALYPESKSIVQLFEEQVANNPNQTCILYQGQTLTYHEVNIRANRLARAIRKQFQRVTGNPLTVDTLLPIFMLHGLDFVIAIWAVLKAGGAYVPVDPSHPSQRICMVLDDLQAPLIITEAILSDSLNVIAPNIPSVCIDDVEIAQEDPNNLEQIAAPFNLAYVMYTSGTTGKPKGVMVEHRNVVSLVTGISYLSADASDTFMFLSDVAFDVATYEIFTALLNGARLYIPTQRVQLMLDHIALKQCLLENHITVLLLTKSLFDVLFTTDPSLFASLKYLMVGGEALAKSHMQALCASVYRPQYVINGYGPTENTSISSTYIIDNDLQALLSVPIGKPLSNRTAYVLNKRLQPQPIGAVGTLFVGGAGLARGYFNRPELTAERFIANPLSPRNNHHYTHLYNTQDRVRWLPDGNLEYIGRTDAQVKIRGYRIELQEIETHLLTYPTIRQTVALVQQIGEEKHLTAYYLADEPLDSASLRTFLTGLLPHYMVPHSFVYLEQLPLNANGKTDVRALPLPQAKAASYQHAGEDYTLVQAVHKVWATLLLLDTIDPDIPFFDLGGTSLQLIKVKQMLQETLSINVSIMELFQYTTLRQLAAHLTTRLSTEQVADPIPAPSRHDQPSPLPNEPIAIVGMACRLPQGITDPEAFWQLLLNGGSTIVDLSDQELIKHHTEPSLMNNDNFVKRAGVLEGTYDFDAHFFGYSAREAELMDPQQRHFLECAWQALEHSGNIPEKFQGDIGVFATQGKNRYYDERVYSWIRTAEKAAAYQASLASEKDFLATRLSFKMNLTGPSMTIQTACSGSLVAVNTACDSLRSRQCDMALAGGVSLFNEHGYLYQEGMIESPDGYCRPFDAQADGTVLSSGVGVVVLKRLSDAIAAKDTIYAVIKGWSVNNDGAAKIGYTAPGVSGQSALVQKALHNADLSPDAIDYVEAHGTATPLGDPIEVIALHQVYAPHWKEAQPPCAIGSVKGHIGHTDAAAGIFGLIKAALMLKNQKILPTLHFRTLNPEIAAFNRVFAVPTQTTDWEKRGHPRCAAISSFGMGGTNAHTIIQEYTPQLDSTQPVRMPVLIPFSAKTVEGLSRLAVEISTSLHDNTAESLPSIAFTAQQGRAEFAERGYIVAGEVNGAIHAYTSFVRNYPKPERPSCVYLLSPHITHPAHNLEVQIKFLTKLCDLEIAVEAIVLAEHNGVRKDLEQQLASLPIKIVSRADDIKHETLWIAVAHDKTLVGKPHHTIFSDDIDNHAQAWLGLLGRLWSHGVAIPWTKASQFGDTAHKLPIPTYPFSRQTYALPKPSISSMASADALSETVSEPKHNTTRDSIRFIWGKVLGIKTEAIEDETDFFDLGGDSISFIDVFSTVKQTFSLDITLEDLLPCSTVQAMTVLVDSQ